MPQFSRRTILAGTDILVDFGHNGVDRFVLEHNLENAGFVGSLQAKANTLARFLLQEPERQDQDGKNLIDTIVGELTRYAVGRCMDLGRFDFAGFQQRYAALVRGLERDGFTVEDGQLRRALPEALDLPSADDEVHAFVNQFGFLIPKGHLDQGIVAHARGDWAAAKAQFRPFIESLLDEMAERLVGGRSVVILGVSGSRN